MSAVGWFFVADEFFGKHITGGEGGALNRRIVANLQLQPFPRAEPLKAASRFVPRSAMKHMEPEAEPAQSSRSRVRAICEETRHLHEALPAAPSGTPADMTFVTMTLRLGVSSRRATPSSRSLLAEDSHTFVGPPDQVNTWMEQMRKALRLDADSFLIVFKENKYGEWGEDVSISGTGFLPGRHYRLTACPEWRKHDPNRAPCQFCPPPHGPGAS